jgi:bifunctional non-homologous end joining protein LigD
MIQGAKSLEMPGFIAPQLAALRTKAPSGDQWLHEIKYDGYRVQLHVNKQRRTIFTRKGFDWTKRFSVIAGAFDVPVERAILDGEIVVIKDGRTSFSELQAELAKGNQDSLLFYAFDLLFLEGFDLRKAPLVERKRILKMLFDETGLASPIIYSEHLQTDGNKMLEHACKLKFEGIISKNAEAPYRSERSDAWIKVKCLQRGKFTVVGFVKDPTGVASLHLARQDSKELIYAGKVGTGWSRTVSSEIRNKLDTVVTSTSKLATPIRDPKATWVEPTFLAEVEYREITADGLLRAASFKGLSKRTGKSCILTAKSARRHSLHFAR